MNDWARDPQARQASDNDRRPLSRRRRGTDHGHEDIQNLVRCRAWLGRRPCCGRCLSLRLAKPESPVRSTSFGRARTTGDRRTDDPLLPRSRRSALVVAVAEEGPARARLSPGLRRRRGGFVRAPRKPRPPPQLRRLQLAQNSLLSQPDGTARHIADAKERLDGHGLHPRLRRRGRRRRQDRQGESRQGPAHRRAQRSRGGARADYSRSAASAP